MRFPIVGVLAALGLGLSASAQAASCPDPAAWAKPEHHRAARSAEVQFALKPGAITGIGLLPQDQVMFAAGAVTRTGYAGIAAIDVAEAGTLRLLVSNRTFVDLVRDGRALELAGAPGHADCPGARKTLSFAVTPGRYLVQLSGSAEKDVTIAILPG